MMSMPLPIYGEAWLCSFPFWVFVDTTDPCTILEVPIEDRVHRFYPLFRSGEANFQPMPYINGDTIPFLQDPPPGLVKPLKRMAAIPALGTDARGEAAITLTLGPEWSEKPAIFPTDSLRLDIQGTHDAVPEYPNYIAGKLMEQLRWLTGQWWITRSTAGLLGYIRNSFGVDENGLPLTDPDGLSCTRTVTGFEIPVTGQLWAQAIDRLEAEQPPPEYDLLILDAHYFLSIGDYRRAVLDAVTGCEQARNIAIERIYRSRSGEAFRKGRLIKSDNLPDSLDHDLSRFIGRSYAREFPARHQGLATLWDCRGRVAHGGVASIRVEDGWLPLDEQTTTRLVEAARHCASWLDALS